MSIAIYRASTPRGTDGEKGRSMQAQTASYEATEYQMNETDKLFGVCQAIGEDFGFNPFFLRLAMLGGMFFSLPGMVVAYAALGVTVALSRWLFPRAKSETNETVASTEPQPTLAPIAREPELIAA
jgi:phage shock protein C